MDVRTFVVPVSARPLASSMTWRMGGLSAMVRGKFANLLVPFAAGLGAQDIPGREPDEERGAKLH